MTSSQIVQHLLKQEEHIQRRRDAALARGRWSVAIECETQLEFSTRLRDHIVSVVTDEEAQSVITKAADKSNPAAYVAPHTP